MDHKHSINDKNSKTIELANEIVMAAKDGEHRWQCKVCMKLNIKVYQCSCKNTWVCRKDKIAHNKDTLCCVSCRETSPFKNKKNKNKAFTPQVKVTKPSEPWVSYPPKPFVERPKASSWTCTCKVVHPMTLKYCDQCYQSWICGCAKVTDTQVRFCSVCKHVLCGDQTCPIKR